MRFYFGFSKKIPIKWILIVIGGLLAFFGIFKSAYALDISELTNNKTWFTNGSIGEPNNYSGSDSFIFSCSDSYSYFRLNFNNTFTNTTSDYIVFSVNVSSSYFSASDTGILISRSFPIYIQDTLGTSYLCDYHDGYILCPALKDRTYNALYFDTSSSSCYTFNASGTTQYVTNGTISFKFSQYPRGYVKAIDSNTQAIIDNQQQQTQQIIDSNTYCKNLSIGADDIVINNSYLNSSGTVVNFSGSGVTDFIPIHGGSITVSEPQNSNSYYYCFYDSNKISISCSKLGTNISIPTNAYYFRSTINTETNRPVYDIYSCQSSSNVIANSIDDSSVDISSTSGGGFFDNFTVDDSRGFSSIIVSPLQFLRDLLTSSSSCSPLSFGITMQDDNINVSKNGLTFPCGDVLWSRVPATIEVIWVTLIWGLVGYRLLLDMVKFINNSLNPEYSKEYFLEL